MNRDSRPATTLLENPVIGGTAQTGRPARAIGDPSRGLLTSGSAGRAGVLRRTHREAPRASRRCRETPWEPRISRRSAGPGSDRPRDVGSTRSSSRRWAARRSMRGGSRRRRSPRRFGMSCSGGERPGASGRTSADVRARSCGPRAIRRHGVSPLLFLRVGGAETPLAMDREAARPRQRGRVTARWPKRPRIGVRTPWTAAALVAAKRAGWKPSRR